MLSDNRVHVNNGFTSHDTSSLAGARVIGLLVPRVLCLQRSQESNELRRKPLQGGHLGGKDGVSASLRGRNQEKSGETRGLEFITDIRVPGGCDGVVVCLVVERRVLVAVDKVQVGEIRGMARSWVDVKTAEVAAWCEQMCKS